MSTSNPLDEQIAFRSQEISTDAYAMSVGEVLSLYRDGELNLHPEFQRFFRWSEEQKSRLIESLLLGIPIPPIFVSQDSSGRWDVIDGLQRLSTIFELTGELLDEEGQKKPPLVLRGTKYLPDLKGKMWGDKDASGADILTDHAKLRIKRARLDIKIVLNKSDSGSKYELFDRLNTGGSAATPQEVRNCLLLMINPGFFKRLAKLGKYQNFIDCLPLTEKQLAEQYPLELVVRFITLRKASTLDLSQMPDLGPWLTDRITSLAENKDFDWEMEERCFCRTFDALVQTLQDDSFRRYSHTKGRAEGAFLISVFEVIALGLGFHLEDSGYTVNNDEIVKTHREIWSNGHFSNGTGSGIRPTTRLPVTIPLGRDLFKP
jgi:hypothetical protein